MNFTKLFSKSALLLLMSITFAACNAETNATSGVDATGQSEVEGALEDGTAIEDNISQAEENVTTEEVAEDTEDLIGQLNS